MAKNLLVTHIDLDGISPIILLNLTGIDFEYKTKNIDEVINKITSYIDIINTLKSKEKTKKIYFVGVWYNKDDGFYYWMDEWFIFICKSAKLADHVRYDLV
mgnify:CR=1 FL=1